MQQLQPQKQVQHFSDLGLPMHDLPSELNCVFVFNFPHQEKHLPQNIGKKPIRVTFKSTELRTITIHQLREKYQKLVPASSKRKNLRFTLSRGFVLKMRSSLAEVKNLLRRPSIDGIVLYTFQGVAQSESDDEDEEVDYSNQCGIMDFIHQQPQFDAEYKHTIHFNLPKSNYVISITLSPEENVETLQNLFYKEVYRVFGREITSDDVKEFKIRESKEVLVGAKAVGKHKGLFDDSEIDVVLTGKVKLEQVMLENYPMTLIKEWINAKTNTKMSKSQVVNYYEVRGMHISKIREIYFAGEENPNNPSCLKVMEFILRPKDRLNRLDNAVLKLKDLGKVRLVGYFITEKMLFYRDVPQILGAGASQFSLTELEIPTEQVAEKEKCERLVGERLDKIQPGYFQDRTRIQPILIYTSQLKYKDHQTNQVLTIYSALNQNLRNKSVLHLKPHEIANEWVFRYTSTLLRHLQNIKGQEGKVFRGVNYDPDVKKGDMMTFKPFTSTSRNMQVSLLFALQAFAGPDENPVMTLFEMEIRSGKPISKFSYFGDKEEELLLEPYTEFVVKEVKSKEMRVPDCEGGTLYPYRHYFLEEVISPREMPNVSNNYILWVDEKPHEGLETFNRFIEEFSSPTVLFQIRSTEELLKWLNERTQIITDTSAKILFVTNMVRTENGQRNFYAGVDSINLVRTRLPNIPIIVYVGDRQASENNLNDKQVPRDNLEVINRFEDFIKFVERHLNLKFISLVPKEPPKEQPKQEPKEEQQQSSSIKGKEKSSKSSCQVM